MASPTDLPYLPTVIAPTGGVNAYGGQGMDYQFTLSLTGTSGGEVTITLTDALTGFQTQLGAGNVTGVLPSFIYTFNGKIYALSGAVAYFTEVGTPDVWNDPNGAGNGFIDMSLFNSMATDLQAVSPYQGNLAFIFRRVVEIWHTDPDPALYVPVQVLENIGTVAPESVKSVGDMDIYMLADNGFRSVRVRDASNNAILADVGVPIDSIVVDLLATLTDSKKAESCAEIEPSSNRYLCYIPKADDSMGKILVFSYFPGAQIAAWGIYLPTYQTVIDSPSVNYAASTVTYTGLTIGQRYAWMPGAHEVSITCGTDAISPIKGVAQQGAFVATATTAVVTGTGATVMFTGSLSQTDPFIPTKFLVFNGQVWVRAGNALFQLGGSDNQQYDNCGVTWKIPYIDGGNPGTRKQYEGLDAALQGTWKLSASADYTTAIYKQVYNNTASTFLLQAIGWQAAGTHYSFGGVESSNGYALFSSIVCHMKRANEK